MQSVVVYLPNLVFLKASEEAREFGMDVGSFCAGILSDHFLTTFTSNIRPQSRSGEPTAISAAANGFNVAEVFPNFPRGSIELAQAFVDDVLQFPGVRAYKKDRGIGFEPNFVFIEYLASKGGKTGITVSFYGQPERHINPPEILVKGIPSYSRARVQTQSELKAVLPHIRQAYELKFGGLSDKDR
jgi:hypothetical protein